MLLSNRENLALVQFGDEKKQRSVLSNYKADVGPIPNPVVMVSKKRSLMHFVLVRVLQPRFQITRVQSRTIAQLWGKICRFLPLKM